MVKTKSTTFKHKHIPVQIITSLTVKDILNLLERRKGGITMHIDIAGNEQDTSSNEESLQQLEQASLQDYLNQESYEPSQEELDYYRSVMKQ